MRKTTFLIFILFFVSCCSPKIVEHTITKTEYRDRYVHDTAIVKVPYEVERIITLDTISHLENTYAKSDAVIHGRELHHSLETKPNIIKVPVEVRVTDTVYTESTVFTEKEYVEKDLSAWQQFRLKTYGWLLGLLGVSGIALFRKPLFKLIKSFFI